MFRGFAFLIFCLLCLCSIAAVANPFQKDYKSQEIKYQYGVLKDDLKYKRDNKLLNREPSGYMTVDEYERQSEFKDRSTLEFDVGKIEKPSDFKYVPKPLYKIVKYNEPAGSQELSLGKRLFALGQLNAQGIVSPDYTKLVYPAVYYYQDTGSTATDLFVIPLEGDDTNLTKILKANVAKREINPIMSTEKLIDNQAAFRSLTPVDFSADGRKILVKEKLGSSEDGIWETRIYVYDFLSKKTADLSVIRDGISYFWKEYVNLNLIAKRWDILPLGFDSQEPDRVVVQAFAYTGEKPVYLGAWSIDYNGNQTRLVSFDREFVPSISSNGFKVVKYGVEAYTTVQAEEKMLKSQDKILEKQKKSADKQVVKQIKEDYKYELKTLEADLKDEYKDNKKLQSFKGTTELNELQALYEQYQQEQLAKDIKKLEKQIDKQQKKIDKLEEKIQKKTDQTQDIIDNQLNNIYSSATSQNNTEEDDDTDEY